jgi:hypothetical protein
MENTVVLEGSLPVKPIIWKYVGKTRLDQPLSGEITARTEDEAIELIKRMGVISPKITANSVGLPISVNFEPNREALIRSDSPLLSPNDQETELLSIPGQIGKMASTVESSQKTSPRRRRESIFFGEFDSVRSQSERAFAELYGRTKQAVMQSDCHGKVQILLVVEHDEWEEKHESQG